ncbi:MAG: hypothetical protein IJJ03_01585, partial [Mogibacterium sp.]|nr:hypothetical protein [Mogibacterium sp.]
MNLITFLHVTLESGFALFCMLAVLSVRMYDTGARKATRVIIATLLMNAVINIADALAYVYRGDPTNAGCIMVRISNFVVFAGMFVLLALGNKLLDTLLEERGAGENKKQCNTVYGLCGAGVTLIVLSAFFGFLYSFDAQNFYHRGVLYPVLPVLAAAAVFILISRTLNEREALPESEYKAFMCIWVLPVLGMAAQTLYYGISLSNICNSIAVMIMTTIF